jgi:abequosyltransferase
MLLTIAIPTYNRVELLKRCLESLATQIMCLPPMFQGKVDLYVSDNCSNDGSKDFLLDFEIRFRSIRVVFNKENRGPDWNIANCYDIATGDYVLVLGDDDVLVEGALEWILLRISNGEYGLLFLKPYSGNNFINPPPNLLARDLVANSDDIILKLSDRLTFISSLVVRKDCFDRASRYLGTHLPQTYVAMEVLNKVQKHIISGRYFVFATRNNGGVVIDGIRNPPPPFGEVFIKNIFNAFGQYKNYSSLRDSLVRKIFFYYFLYEISRREEKGGVMLKTKTACDEIMGQEFFYQLVRPLMFSPHRLIRFHLLQLLSLIFRVLRGELLKFLNFWLRTHFSHARKQKFTRKKGKS